MPKRSTWEQSHPECAAATREAVDAVRAEKDREIERLQMALREIHTNVELLAKGGPTVVPAAWYFQVIEGICRGVLNDDE